MMKRTLLISVLAIAMTGCAALKFQWAASYQTDNLVEDARAARMEQSKPSEPAKP